MAMVNHFTVYQRPLFYWLNDFQTGFSHRTLHVYICAKLLLTVYTVQARSFLSKLIQLALLLALINEGSEGLRVNAALLASF